MLWSIVTNKGYFYNIFLFCDGIKMSLQYRSLCYKSTIFYHPIPYKKSLPFLNIMLYPYQKKKRLFHQPVSQLFHFFSCCLPTLLLYHLNNFIISFRPVTIYNFIIIFYDITYEFIIFAG